MKNTIKERQYCECDSAVGAGSLQAATVIADKPVSSNWLRKTVQFVAQWNERRIQRNILRALTSAQLRDIGLTNEDIDKEYERKGWPNWPK